MKKEEDLKRIIMSLAVCCIAAGWGVPAFALQKEVPVVLSPELVESVAKGCETEIRTYCRGVTPGEGRVLACLYAFWDKLSDQCDNALYDAAAQLSRAVNTLTYVANECWADLETYCANIQPGEGRLLQCFEKNDAKITKRCKQALKETGQKK
jgi:Cysteine rich repeat